MAINHPQTFQELDEDATVRAILEGTATATGECFFAALVIIKIDGHPVTGEDCQI